MSSRKQLSDLDFRHVSLYSETLINEQLYNAYSLIAKDRNLDELVFLDAGCGRGQLTRELADLVSRPEQVLGCDIDRDCIEFSRKMNPAIQYFQHDLLQPLPEQQKFDVIFLTTALAQFSHQDQQQVLNNLEACLNPGGYFFILDVNSDRTGAMFSQLKQTKEYAVIYNRKLARSLLGIKPAVMLAGRVPFLFLRLMEAIVPGRNMLQLLVVQKT
ncbi:class I SAM-dependent methyltransferase [Spongorhabdus nitratireducens]